ncbi:hypothetical protein [Streptomyces sp. WAC04114]|nr:hypothetical protein [Streptomyces sp. WAC04114]MBX9359804.1 hypothetical protein [Streptomyces sp. WAC04114]
MDDGDVLVDPRSLEFADAVAVADDGDGRRAMLDVLGVGAPHGQASVGDY